MFRSVYSIEVFIVSCVVGSIILNTNHDISRTKWEKHLRVKFFFFKGELCGKVRNLFI